jgi:hypothetical protein
MTSIIAPNFEEMSRTMAMLPNYWMEIELKVDEGRCTDFEVGNSVFRIDKGDIEAESLIRSMTKFWSKSEALLRVAKEIWQGFPSKIVQSFDTDLTLRIDNLGGVPVDQVIELCSKQSSDDPGRNKSWGLPPVRFKVGLRVV